MAEPGTTNNKNNHISDLVDQHAKIDKLKQPFFGHSKLSESVFQISIIPRTLLISAFSTQNMKKIDYLIDIMQSFALLSRILQIN